MTKTKLAAISAILTGMIGLPLVLQHQSILRLREENDALRQELQELGQLAIDHSNLLARAENLQTLANAEKQELIKLRGEVGLLRRQTNEAEKIKLENRRLRAAANNTQNVETPKNPIPWSAPVPAESWSFAGYATPEAALQTVVSAMSKGEWDLFLASYTAEGRKQLEENFKGTPVAEALAQFPLDFSKALSYKFTRKDISENEVQFMLAIELPFNNGYGKTITMKRIGNEWKAE